MTEGASISNVARATPLVFAIMRSPETLLVLTLAAQGIREFPRKKPTKRCSKDAIRASAQKSNISQDVNGATLQLARANGKSHFGLTIEQAHSHRHSLVSGGGSHRADLPVTFNFIKDRFRFINGVRRKPPCFCPG